MRAVRSGVGAADGADEAATDGATKAATDGATEAATDGAVVGAVVGLGVAALPLQAAAKRLIVAPTTSTLYVMRELCTVSSTGRGMRRPSRSLETTRAASQGRGRRIVRP